jgi:uncharacterized protein DUF1707
MVDPSGHRVSDEQREACASQLRQHFAAGRLSDDELDERLQRAYSAQTQGDLTALSADLPRLPATRQEQRAEIARRRGELQRRLLQQTGASAGAFLVCTAIWLTSGANGQFWPIWVALVAVIPLMRNGWRLYGPAPELDRVEEELAQREGGDRARRSS